MADNTAQLKNTSSYSTLMRAVDTISTPAYVHALRMFHTGQVVEDGLNIGTQGLVASIVGMPVDIWDFAKERITGQKLSTPENERKWSSAWIEKNLETQYTDYRRTIEHDRPKLREGTTDELVHIGSQAVPLIASLFVPGAGEAKLASAGKKVGSWVGKAGDLVLNNTTVSTNLGKAGALVGKGLGNAAFQINIADIVKIGREKFEDWGWATAPKEAPQINTKDKTTKTEFNNASHIVKGSPVFNSKDLSILGHVLGGGLRDNKDPIGFSADNVKNLQKLLIETHRLESKNNPSNEIDGFLGAKTVAAIDAVVKQNIHPESMTDDMKKLHSDRMKDIIQELKTAPASEYNFDPRIIELQTHGYALGLYNKKIDGLTGPETEKAIASFAQQLPESVQPKSKEKEITAKFEI